MTQILNAPVATLNEASSNIWTMTDSVSSLSVVLTSGYLSAQQAIGASFQSTDVIYISYNGGAGFFSFSFSGSVITLVSLPVNGSQIASIAMTAAEFNGMYAAPKLLVAAPGAGNLLIPSRMQIILTYGSAAFAGGGAVSAQYDSTASGAGVKATNTEAAADFFVTASTVFSFISTSGNTVGALPFATCVNKGLYLSNATGAFTTGTGSSIIVKVKYDIISVA